MAVTRGDYVTSPIANTTMQEKLRDGVLYMYALKAETGYVLHDKAGDWDDMDENGNITMKLAFYRGECTCLATYDFVANPREFYAVVEDSVPTDQIFGGVGNNDHEVM